MSKPAIEHWAEVLNTSRLQAKPIPQISKEVTDFSRRDAYAIQERQMAFRQRAGEKLIGWKMGLTSEAKRRQMNLDSPLYGFLTNRMQIPSGGVFKLKGAIHPKIEPEVAFWIAQDLFGSVTRDQVLAACGGVAAGLEILDSRYDQFKYFSMEDVIADNSSSSHFLLGEWRRDFSSVNLIHLDMEMKVDGAVVQKGNSEAISGDPVNSVIQLCELLAERDRTLAAGSIVLAGAATAAVELKPGMRVELEVAELAPVHVTIESGV